jgi:hypothetical protein
MLPMMIVTIIGWYIEDMWLISLGLSFTLIFWGIAFVRDQEEHVQDRKVSNPQKNSELISTEIKEKIELLKNQNTALLNNRMKNMLYQTEQERSNSRLIRELNIILNMIEKEDKKSPHVKKVKI